MRHLSRGVRLAIIAAGSAALVAATGVIVWRVLGPAEVVTPATKPYPAPIIPATGPIGALVSAPLVVDDSLRIYAAKRQVWADATPVRRYETSAFWSYRRWPAQVVGVVASSREAASRTDPVIVTAWSDGGVTALDGRTGNVRWRAEAQAPSDEFPGPSSGADVVYRPAGLFTATIAGGRAVVVAGPSQVSWFSVEDGSLLGTAAIPAGDCRGADFTTPGSYLVLDTCTQTVRTVALTPRSPATPAADQVTALEPLGCAQGHSDCTGVRLTQPSGTIGWLRIDTGFVPSAPLAEPATLLVGGVAVSAPNPASTIELTARDPQSGDARWTWHPAQGSSDEAAEVLGAGTDRILLLTPSRTLIAVSAETGKELSRASVILPLEPPAPYQIRTFYQSNRYIALERTTPTTTPHPAIPHTPRPILLSGS